MISFKTIHNMGPTFLSDLINIKQCSRYNLRSFVGVISQDSTAKFKCTLGDISFTAAAPKIWNGLPDYIKKENDFDMFKRLIKTQYFKEANSDLSQAIVGLFYLLFYTSYLLWVMLKYLLALVKKYNTFFKLECTCGIRARCGALQRLHIRKSSMDCKNL